MSIGCAIKYFREKLFPMQGGQAEFAAALGVTRQEVSAWENGRRTPTLKNLRKIAKALNVGVDEIQNHRENSVHEHARQEDAEYWKDLAIAYKEKITGYEAEIKKLKSELKKAKRNE